MFRVGLTRDYLSLDGRLGFADMGLDWLSQAEALQKSARQDDGLLVLAPRITACTVDTSERLEAEARFAIGFSNLDVPACPDAGVI